jgi:hypothetical protein
VLGEAVLFLPEPPQPRAMKIKQSSERQKLK